MLAERHRRGVRDDEWGPHGFADEWFDCPACTDLPQTHAFANLIRAYWRAVDVLAGRV